MVCDHRRRPSEEQRVDQAKSSVKYHEQLACAQTALKNLPDAEVSRILTEPPINTPLPPGSHLDDAQLDLQRVQTTTWGEVFEHQPPTAYSHAASFLPPFTIGLGITFAITLAVYGLVRAILLVTGLRHFIVVQQRLDHVYRRTVGGTKKQIVAP